MKLVIDFALITAFLFNLLILFLLAKNKKSSQELHKRILQIIFSLVALSLCFSYAYLHKIKILFYATFIFDESIATLIGPLLFLYIKSIFLPTKGLLQRNWIHFVIPVVYLFVGSIPSLIFSYSKTELFSYIFTYKDFIPLVIVYSLIYCIVSLGVLKRAEQVIKRNYSNLTGIDLSWIKWLLIGSVVVISIDVLSTLYELCFGELEWNTLYLTSIGTVILIVYLGYHGVLQSKILIAPFLLKKEEDSSLSIESKKVVFPHNYTPSELIELEKQLETIMREQKPFLDENLSLKSLAELLTISDKKLSALLNQHIKISFYEYVNGFKVADVIDKMKDPSYDNYTLLAIAFESGFNSKTSFNRIFKKVTNLSPSAYKKQIH